MIRAIPDTNILLRGFFGYKSNHRKILSLAKIKRIQLLGSSETFTEFCEKVYMKKFQKYWESKIFTPEKIILDYKSIIILDEPTLKYKQLAIPIDDPDDAIFIKLALSANVRIMISEDKHLTALDGYKGIRVISADEFIGIYLKINNELGLSATT